MGHLRHMLCQSNKRLKWGRALLESQVDGGGTGGEARAPQESLSSVFGNAKNSYRPSGGSCWNIFLRAEKVRFSGFIYRSSRDSTL
ncbi:hypothetical protein GWI33_010233 [Rhynchophorus ferrugineus]|uniref:Uncharacterized protein n=1 Tax=Rhynchophorus ferrugineus TaxID=354439 RepID=A0A834I9I5_RHYFE|nr:hypothetical protein GWI33_010233 [Rhynchophorus ferrugineus]